MPPGTASVHLERPRLRPRGAPSTVRRTASLPVRRMSHERGSGPARTRFQRDSAWPGASPTALDRHPATPAEARDRGLPRRRWRLAGREDTLVLACSIPRPRPDEGTAPRRTRSLGVWRAAGGFREADPAREGPHGQCPRWRPTLAGKHLGSAPGLLRLADRRPRIQHQDRLPCRVRGDQRPVATRSASAGYSCRRSLGSPVTSTAREVATAWCDTLAVPLRRRSTARPRRRWPHLGRRKCAISAEIS
jgi:hypothetical protein